MKGRKRKTCYAVLNKTDGVLWWECSSCGELIHNTEKQCLVCNSHINCFIQNGKPLKRWLKIKTI